MRLLSLFSGGGGMDIGFEGGFSCLKRSVPSEYVAVDNGSTVVVKPTGFRTVFANDIRPYAKAAWVSYFGQKYPDAGDLYCVESVVELVKRARNGEDVFPHDIDIVAGGFPCQDFSLSGKRLGFNSYKSHDGQPLDIDAPSIESRGRLYMWMRDVITITHPKMFVAENVRGLTNWADAQQIIEHDFADAANGGYLVIPARILHAADYGVPQSRERVIFLGFRKSALTADALAALTAESIPADYDPYPPRTHSYTTADERLLAPVTCAEAFASLKEPTDASDIAQRSFSHAKYLETHCQGQTEICLNSIAPTIRSEHHGNIEFRRLSREHGGIHTDELNAGLPERRLTVRECARIQTFPDNYPCIVPKGNGTAGVSASDAYKVIGNAVPCVLAYNIARRLADKWTLYFGRDKDAAVSGKGKP